MGGRGLCRKKKKKIAKAHFSFSLCLSEKGERGILFPEITTTSRSDSLMIFFLPMEVAKVKRKVSLKKEGTLLLADSFLRVCVCVLARGEENRGLMREDMTFRRRNCVRKRGIKKSRMQQTLHLRWNRMVVVGILVLPHSFVFLTISFPAGEA